MRYRAAAVLMLVTAGCTSTGVAQPASSRQSGAISNPTAARQRHAHHHRTTTRTRRPQRGGAACRLWTCHAAN